MRRIRCSPRETPGPPAAAASPGPAGPPPVLGERPCLRCGTCEAVCPAQAIVLEEEGPRIDAARCDRCLECVETCPTGALLAA